MAPRRRFWTLPRILLVLLVLLTLAVFVRTRWWRFVIGYPSGPAQWRQLEEGLEYRRFTHGGITVHAVRVDLRRFELRVADARSQSRKMADVPTFVREHKGIVAVNGTFFDRDQNPLGWLVDRGQQLNPPNGRNWYSTFVVLDGPEGVHGAVLAPGATPPELTSVRLALQAGPRTVIAGQPVELRPTEAERTAVCVVSPTSVVLLATEGVLVGEDWLAHLMARPEREGGFSCRDGMMFDGGPSTQMAVRTPTLQVDVPGGWPVPNAVVVSRSEGGETKRAPESPPRPANSSGSGD